ncbi:MAG: hypothetical protein U9N02_04065 [Campylobacterota bacterium]|nr:hypothetical protein [Campylobacterota bacterium]
MYRLLLVITIVIFSGCSSKTEYNSVICEELKSTPNETVPKECRIYNEAEATKAFNKVVDEKQILDKDIIEYKEEK